MKKKTIFKHELNESIQANAAMNCLKNRNNHKQLNETSDFDERFGFRKDLRELASPATKKAYMIIRKEFGDGMWRRLYMDDCDERGIISLMNDYQKYYNITNPQDIADCMLGRKSVRSFKKSREQQEEEETTLSESELEDLTFKLADYLLESFIILEDEDEDYSNLLEAVEKILKKDAPKSKTQAGYYAWCRKWFMKIEDLTYSYYNEPNPESYHIDEQEEVAEDKYDIALKHVKKYKSRLPRLYGDNPEMFMMLKLYKTIGQDPMKLPRDEYRAWAKAICDACKTIFGGKAQEQEEQEEQEDYGMNDLRKWRDSLDFSNNNDDDDEETYTAYDDTDGIWLIINLMRKQGMLRAQGIEGRDDVDDGHAIDKAYDLIEQKLDEEGMWIGDDDHEAERFVSFFGDEIAAEAMKSAIHQNDEKHLKESIGEMYPDSRWGEKEHLNGPNGMSKSERDVLIKLEQIIPNLVQKAMTKTADHDNPEEIKKLVLNMIMQGNLMQKLGNKVGASWKEFSMGFRRELINLIKNEFAKHEEQEELPSMERHDMILALSEYMSESWIDTGDDGDLDDIYYAVADILDNTGDYPASTSWEDCKPWCQKHYKEVEARIY